MADVIPFPARRDYSVGFTALLLCDGLSATDRRVAAAILKHHNARTGRCDPSVARLAELLGIGRASVMRATAALCKADPATGRAAFFDKVTHGGRGATCSYRPNWAAFQDVVDAFENKAKAATWRNRPATDDPATPHCEAAEQGGQGVPLAADTAESGAEKVSELIPHQSQPCDVSGIRTDTQTLIQNSNQNSTGRAREDAGASLAGRAARALEAMRADRQAPDKGDLARSNADPVEKDSGKAVEDGHGFAMPRGEGGPRPTVQFRPQAIPRGDGPMVASARWTAAEDAAAGRLDDEARALGQRFHAAALGLPESTWTQAKAAEVRRRGAGLAVIRQALAGQGGPTLARAAHG